MVKRGRRALELAAAAGVGAALAYLLLPRASRTAIEIDAQATTELQAKLKIIEVLKKEELNLAQALQAADLREQGLTHGLSQALQQCQEEEAKLQQLHMRAWRTL